MSIELTAYLNIVIDGITVSDDQVEARVTCSLDCNEEMSIDRIEIDNTKGTGWLRWDWADVRKPVGLKNEFGQMLFVQAYADESLRADFYDQMREAA